MCDVMGCVGCYCAWDPIGIFSDGWKLVFSEVLMNHDYRGITMIKLMGHYFSGIYECLFLMTHFMIVYTF
jgi:hypothetical protein